MTANHSQQPETSHHEHPHGEHGHDHGEHDHSDGLGGAAG